MEAFGSGSRIGGSRPRPDSAYPGLGGHDDATPVYVISIAAELAGMHPQTLRQYDRLGIVSPGRSSGRGRRYSAREVALLREVQRLSQEEGVNLEGIRRILALENQVEALQARVRELEAEVVSARLAAETEVAAAQRSQRRDLVPVKGEVVVWRRR
ncbi:MAG: MerR family transcriptional regulator, heat shock protein HspR [Frankiaceae bacterium]|nr:MerR family transcriptional regulator, heat shock protein HspR [Frankiaceae bacterium]MDQ1634680.1 MerR family transcriptional regulator, heat shock protein HspR [Frankiaceae bacterium]MDQ1673655.1 MerR family transcriptional regulator, heat shock protein HspR [Frankiaceae bacterium]